MLIYYFFSIILIYFSYRSFRGGFDYLAYFRDEIARPESGFKPFCSIIAPCKGIDQDLRENLAALFLQEFPRYEVIFALDNENDPAIPIIKEVIGAHYNSKRTAKIIIAGEAHDSSQKVENLREAILQTDKEAEIFAFADSDARPGKDWLKNLIAPLEDKSIGCSTGYRWFISKGFSFSSELRSVWNASIASALGGNTKSNFCWGGSMAIRREIFERLEMREKWKGTLSDDFAVTRAMKEAGLPIVFVPKCITASIENCTFRELLEFTARQMKITRVYAPNLWKLSFFGSFLFNAVMLASIILLISGIAFWAPLITIFLVSIFSIGKAWLRLKAIRLALKGHEQALRWQFIPQNTLWLFSPAIFLYNCFSALISRKITWRGISYELISPNETKVTK